MLKRALSVLLAALTFGFIPACGCVYQETMDYPDVITPSEPEQKTQPAETEETVSDYSGAGDDVDTITVIDDGVNSNYFTLPDSLSDDEDHIHFYTEEENVPYSDVDTVSYQEALNIIKENMIEREPEFSVDVAPFVADSESILGEIYSVVVAHTGVPDEGDYLLTQIGDIQMRETSYFYNDTVIYERYSFDVTYCSDWDQEVAVSQYIDSILRELNIDTLDNDYAKISSIYSWITAHVEYDYDNLDDDDYFAKYSAYAALFDGKAVCQGCSALLYRMLLTAGIDCRCVRGTADGNGHMWNIVNLDGTYYNVDVTWDLGRSADQWHYFLKGSDDFDWSHVRDTDALSGASGEYNIARADYEAQLW